MAVLLLFGDSAMPASNQEAAFFIALGERIARLRKKQGMTQAQLAETLGVSQQTVQSYEVGRRRIQADALPALAEALGVSVGELLGHSGARGTGKRGPTARWQRQIEAIDQLPKTQQRFVAQMLDALIAQAQR